MLLGLLLPGEPLLTLEALLALELLRLSGLHLVLWLLLLLLLRALHLRERRRDERGRSQQCRCKEEFHTGLPSMEVGDMAP